MRNTLRVFGIGMQAILRDAILLVLLPAPLLTALAIRLMLVFLSGLLAGQAAFSPGVWYPLADALMLALGPLMMAVCSAFLLLEECDAGICGYYYITPAGHIRYLAARIAFPILWGFLCGILAITLFGLSHTPLPRLLACALLAALAALATAMLVVALAANRVEGMAVSKLAGLSLLGLLPAWFIPGPLRYIGGVLPSFWLGELALGKPYWPSLPLGILAALLWALLFTRRFFAKIS